MSLRKRSFVFGGFITLILTLGCGGNHSPNPDGGTTGSDGGTVQGADGGAFTDAGPAAQLLDPCDPLSVNSRCVGEAVAECSLVQGAYRLTASMTTCMTTSPCYEGADATGKVTAQCGCTLGTNAGCTGNLSQCYRYTDPMTHKVLQTCSCIAGKTFCQQGPIGDPQVDAPDHIFVYTCLSADALGNAFPYPQARLWECSASNYNYAEYCGGGANGCLICAPAQYINHSLGAGASYYCDTNDAPVITSCPATVCVTQ